MLDWVFKKISNKCKSTTSPVISTAKRMNSPWCQLEETCESYLCLYEHHISISNPTLQGNNWKEHKSLKKYWSSKLRLHHDWHPWCCYLIQTVQPTFKTTRLKQTYSSEDDQSSPSPITGIYVSIFGINMGKIDWRYLPELCQSPHFHSGSEHTLPVLGSGPWWSKVWKK